MSWSGVDDVVEWRAYSLQSARLAENEQSLCYLECFDLLDSLHEQLHPLVSEESLREDDRAEGWEGRLVDAGALRTESEPHQ